MGQGKLEALAHRLAGVWGEVALSVFECVSLCVVFTCKGGQEEKSTVEESG